MVEIIYLNRLGSKFVPRGADWRKWGIGCGMIQWLVLLARSLHTVKPCEIYYLRRASNLRIHRQKLPRRISVCLVSLKSGLSTGTCWISFAGILKFCKLV